MRRHEEPAELRRARSLATLFDSAFSVPGTRWRFGLDAVIGLIPVIGDMVAAVTSVYIIRLGSRLGLPFGTLMHMSLNILVDLVVGAIPLLGDLFDAGFKANIRNVRLMERDWQRQTARQVMG